MDDNAAMSLDYDVDMSLDDDGYDYDAEKVVCRMIQKEVIITSLNDVPMYPVDDADVDKVLGRVRKKDKVLPPLDNDDDDTGRSIRKVTSLVDVNAYLKIPIRKEREKVMSLNDANLEKIERHSRIMSMDGLSYRDGGLGGGLGTTKLVIQKRILDDDLKLPLNCFQLKYYLPAMAKTFRDKDLSVLRKYCFLTDSSSIENLSVEEALKHELVATCVWFLLTKECPDNTKEGLAAALRFILFKGECDAQGKTSIDQACIDTLVVDALISGHNEIIRQVCEAIFFLVDFSLADISTSIQSELVKLACSLPFSCDALVGISLLTTINRIISENKYGFMREELLKAVLSDRTWLLNIISGINDQTVLEAYRILECLARGEYNDELWEVLLDDIIPEILERDGAPVARLDIVRKRLVISATRIISNTINRATSVGGIGLLALDTDCLHALVGFLDVLDGGDDKCLCMEAIENILKTDEDESEENMFALMIREHKQYVRVYGRQGSESKMHVQGWDLLDNDAPNSKSILLKYAPKIWLRGNMPDEKSLSVRGQEVY